MIGLTTTDRYSSYSIFLGATFKGPSSGWGPWFSEVIILKCFNVLMMKELDCRSVEYLQINVSIIVMI